MINFEVLKLFVQAFFIGLQHSHNIRRPKDALAEREIILRQLGGILNQTINHVLLKVISKAYSCFCIPHEVPLFCRNAIAITYLEYFLNELISVDNLCRHFGFVILILENRVYVNW